MTNEFATQIVLAARAKGKSVNTDFLIEKLPIRGPTFLTRLLENYTKLQNLVTRYLLERKRPVPMVV